MHATALAVAVVMHVHMCMLGSIGGFGGDGGGEGVRRKIFCGGEGGIESCVW